MAVRVRGVIRLVQLRPGIRSRAVEVMSVIAAMWSQSKPCRKPRRSPVIRMPIPPAPAAAAAGTETSAEPRIAKSGDSGTHEAGAHRLGDRLQEYRRSRACRDGQHLGSRDPDHDGST